MIYRSLKRIHRFLCKDIASLYSGRYRTRPCFDRREALQKLGDGSGFEIALGRETALQYIDARPRADAFPALYFLALIASRRGPLRVFDFGGSVGFHYYGFKPRLGDGNIERWTVCELPASAELGRQIATERGENKLGFVGDMSSLDRHSVLYSAGTLQVAGAAFFEAFRKVREKPAFVLLNNVEITEGEPTYYTVYVDRPGKRRCLFTTYSRDELIGSFTSEGYRLVDWWIGGAGYSRIIFSDTIPQQHGFLFEGP